MNPTPPENLQDNPQAEAERNAAPSQATRRVRIGTNVAIAALAALGVVVVLNMLVDFQVQNLPAAAKPFVRYDLTATRRYSLSPQTRQVLEQIEQDHTIVRLFSARGVAEVERVVDLIDEYPRYSSHVSVEDIDPARNVTAVERLSERITMAFAEDVEPLIAAVEQARAATDELGQTFAEVAALLQANADEGGLGEGTAAQVNQFLLTGLSRFAEDLQVADERIGSLIDQPLPDLRRVRDALSGTIAGLAESQLPEAVRVLEAAVRDASAPASARERFLQAVRLIREASQQATQAATALQDAPEAQRYNRVASTLRGQEAVAIIGPDDVRALALGELYREIDEEVAEQQGRPELGFIGEEKLTGALAAMQWEHQPLAVFVYDRNPALGPRGQYSQVGERLEAAGFVVEEWSPRGQQMPGQMGMPGRSIPTPEPEPAEGQPAVWIVLPASPSQPQNPMMMGQDGSMRGPVAELLTRRMAQGDAAMVLFAANPGATFGQADPVADLIAERYGVEPRLDRLAARVQPTPNRPDQTSFQFLVSDWPGESPVGEAVRGMPGMFSVASPVETTEVEGVIHAPLARLTDPRLWLVDDFSSQEALMNAEYETEAAVDSVTIGVTAERAATDDAPGSRLIAVADAMWATDRITTYGQFGPGTAEIAGAAFPANGELFVNGVYWLAGTDELIAATPRSQDIRRIGAVSSTAEWWIGGVLVVGLPLLAAAAGVAVAVSRRAG